jgi:asparagine synthase (glutamine-hydrolysing)
VCSSDLFDVHGYTIMNSDARYEEADMVAAAVTQLQLQHTPIALQTESFFPLLREQVRYHGAPVYTINSFAGWRLAESIARDGYRVSISGIGADELFSGYYDHHNAYLAHVAATDPQRHQAALEEWNQGIGRFVRNPFLKDAGYLIRRPLARDHIFLDSAEFSQWLARPFRESFSELTVTEPLLRNRMANELLAEAVPVVLHEDDLNAMYHSIENRSPYLDAGLFSWATSIPTTHLVRQGRAKAVLREAVRGIAPDEVLDNPRKVGFNAPIDAFIDRRNPLVMDELLAESPVFDVVARTAMSRLLAEEELANSRNKFLFSFVSTKLFLEEFPP